MLIYNEGFTGLCNTFVSRVLQISSFFFLNVFIFYYWLLYTTHLAHKEEANAVTDLQCRQANDSMLIIYLESYSALGFFSSSILSFSKLLQATLSAELKSQQRHQLRAVNGAQQYHGLWRKRQSLHQYFITPSSTSHCFTAFISTCRRTGQQCPKDRR